MTDWTDIDLNNLLPGEPWTSAKATAVYENPIAIAEGAADAPGVYLGALVRPTAGDVIRCARDENVIRDGTGTGNFATVISFGACQWGEARITFEYRRQNGGTVTVVNRLLRTRATVPTTLLTWSKTGTTYTEESGDFSFQPGDLIELQHSVNSDTATHQVQTRFSRFRTNGEDILIFGNTAHTYTPRDLKT